MQALWQDAGQRDRESRFERFSSSAHLPSTDVKKKKWKRRRVNGGGERQGIEKLIRFIASFAQEGM